MFSGQRHRQRRRDRLSPRLPRRPQRDLFCRNAKAARQEARPEHLGVPRKGDLFVEKCLDCFLLIDWINAASWPNQRYFNFTKSFIKGY